MKAKCHVDFDSAPSFIRLPNPGHTIDEKVAEIAAYFKRSGFNKAVIGLSGGVDSALAAALTAEAIGSKNLIAVRLPYEHINDRSTIIAEAVAQSMGLPDANLVTIDITEQVNSVWEQVKVYPGGDGRLRIGNIAARMRMVVLMDQSAIHHALLVGTENLTEHYLSYFTMGGDNVSSFEPIRNNWKTQVFQMAAAIGSPDEVLSRDPSAEFWVGQTDEKELRVPYAKMDIILACEFVNFRERAEDNGVTAQEKAIVLEHVNKVVGKRDTPYILSR